MSDGSDDAFFTAIGWFTVAWASIEAGVDYASTLIYREMGGDQLENERPRSMKNKLRFLRKAAREIDTLAQFPELGPLLLEIRSASKVRNDLIHGFIISAPIGDLPVEMIKLIEPGHTERERQFTVTAGEAKTEALRAMHLARRFSQTVKAIHDQYAPPRSPDGQIP